MNSNQLNPTDPYSLLRIGEAWRNLDGIVTLLITFTVAVLLVVLGARGGSNILAGAVTLSIFCLFAGFSAAGIQFMDQAAGRPITPTMSAVLGSPLVLLRSLGLALLFAMVFLVYSGSVYLVLVVCKVPALGAVLFSIALPVLSFIGALLVLGLTMASLISGAALWEGHPFSAALSQGWAVATARPIQGFLNMMMLFTVTALVAFVVSILVVSGFSVVAGLSASILGEEMTFGLYGLIESVRSGQFDAIGAEGSLVFAGLVGSALVFAVTQALFAANFLLGVALTYLNVTAGLDVSAAQSVVDSAIAKTKEKAQQAAAEAKRRAQEAQAAARTRVDQARAAQVARSAAIASPPPGCPKCHSPITSDDVFCGTCGHKVG